MIEVETFIVVEFSDLPDEIRNYLISYYDDINNYSYRRYYLENEENPLYKLIVEKGFNPETGDVLIKFSW